MTKNELKDDISLVNEKIEGLKGNFIECKNNITGIENLQIVRDKQLEDIRNYLHSVDERLMKEIAVVDN